MLINDISKDELNESLDKIELFIKNIALKTDRRILLPPPNLTGELHIGHIYSTLMADIYVKYTRLLDAYITWIPGLDHGGIATQMIAIRELGKEILKNINTLYSEIDRWKEKYKSQIIELLKRFGFSLNWEYIYYTLSDDVSSIVNRTFESLFRDNIIYQSERIVNICDSCKTVLSDIEVKHKSKKIPLYTLKYKLDSLNEEYLYVSTTRIETIIGDVALVIHPDDERYKKYIGMYAFIPLINRRIPIISDEYVSKMFGTGILKITPAHSAIDYQIAIQHKLPILNLLDDNSIIKEGKYKSIQFYKLKSIILNDLKDDILSIDDEYQTEIPICSRCSYQLDIRLSKQWFININKLLKKIDIDFNQIFINPNTFHIDKYIENMDDWCISRQIVWGHRIPIYFNKKNNEYILKSSIDIIDSNYVEVKDVLDTWFSSSLCPIILDIQLGSNEIENLITGYDILYSWVVRMILISTYYKLYLEKDNNRVKLPFKHVTMHGLVRDKLGRKMSKTLNNGINPKELIENSNIDVVRFALAYHMVPGTDIKYSDKLLNIGNKLLNKIISINKFINSYELNSSYDFNIKTMNIYDQYIYDSYINLKELIFSSYKVFNTQLIVKSLYNFIFNIISDRYILIVRAYEKKGISTSILIPIYIRVLLLLYPIMPYYVSHILLEDFHLNENKLKEMIMKIKSEESISDFNNSFIENYFDTISFIRYLVVLCSKNINNIYIHNYKNLLEVNILTEFLQKGSMFQSKSILEDTNNSIIIKFNHLFFIFEIDNKEICIDSIKKLLNKYEKEIFILNNKLSDKNFCKYADKEKVSSIKEDIDIYEYRKNIIKGIINDLFRNELLESINL